MPLSLLESKKPRVLFMAEAVTLAHVARPVVLARSLDADLYDVHLAQCPRYRKLLGSLPFAEHEISSITPQQFMASLSRGSPVYDLPILETYVEEDLRLLDTLRPDLVVGDFRLSLAVSARLARVPYVAISNAYWSPYVRQHYPVPELPLTRMLGPALGQLLFSLARPLAFAAHCFPMHRLCRRHGLHSLGFDLNRVYTHGDHTLYADIPDPYVMRDLPANHHFIGPVNWSPAIALPDWWKRIPRDRPVVYVTLGSSGQAELLPMLISAFGRMEVTALLSSAGAKLPQSLPQNVFCASYLPGDAAVARAALVICNGGSPTAYQALAAGVPVLGLAGNLDQYLSMAALERTGACRLMRSGRCDAASVTDAVDSILMDLGMRRAAEALSLRISEFTHQYDFSHFVARLQGGTQ